MRILTIHADYIEVEPMKQAIKDAEELKEKGKQRYDEVLVVFSAVEKDDDEEATGERLAKEAMAVAEQVKTKKVLLYPLVHLTSKPSSPSTAKKVMSKAESLLKDEGYEVSHSPFGWYKGYTLKCKGHPLSELSREFTGMAAGASGTVSVKPGEVEVVSKSLQQENQLKSRF
jgi:threonyl-tRNA synthetase